MDLGTYTMLVGILAEAGLTKNDTPDFDKIAEITGHSRDSVKVLLAPRADTPRWVKLLNYVGEKLFTNSPKLFTRSEGVELINAERLEHLLKHGRTIEKDVAMNDCYQLSEAAALLCHVNEEDYGHEIIAPVDWSQTIFKAMMNKPYLDRLVYAGAFIAAEIDRLRAIEPTKENTEVTC